MQNKYTKLLLLLLPLWLWFLQLLMTVHSVNQIRFEELIESVQAPLWFSHRLVLAGTHTNIGWYAFLVGIYQIFGFSLNVPKISLLVIWAISLFCQAVLIRRFFNPLTGVIILLTLGLSPTILFFNTQSLHLGVSLMMVPIFILLLTLLPLKKKFLNYLLEAFIFFLAMIVVLIYPPFVFYIPSVVLFYFWKLKKNWSFLRFSLVFIGFLLPVVLGFFYIQNSHILIYDASSGTGMFRGGGQISFSEDTFSKAWAGLISDFFIKPVSYHFEVSQVDFSLIFPIVTVLFVMYSTAVVYRQKKQARPVINLALLVVISNLLIISITSDYGIPGMKRLTPALAVIYFLWVVAWYYLGKVKLAWPRSVSLVILGLLTAHHLIVYPINLAHIKDLSPFAERQWFATQETPQQSLDEVLARLQKEDVTLDCRPYLTKFTGCGYDFIYSALKDSCLWNHLQCHQIKFYGETRPDL